MCLELSGVRRNLLLKIWPIMKIYRPLTKDYACGVLFSRIIIPFPNIHINIFQLLQQLNIKRMHVIKIQPFSLI